MTTKGLMMMKHLLVAVIIQLMCRKPASGTSYCDMNCEDGTMHTMCQYPEGPSYRCGATYGDVLSREEKDAILTLHNEYRLKFANGEGHHLPTASNMMALSWDNELEAIAQRWTDQCWPRFIHGECRTTEKFPQVNQNSGRTNPGVNISKIISVWYNELDSFERTTIEHYNFNPYNAHFTQMIWAKTTHIGCARAKWNEQQEFICNYAPAGNVLSEPIYERGAPCSKCPTLSWCSFKYNGLCSSTFY